MINKSMVCGLVVSFVLGIVLDGGAAQKNSPRKTIPAQPKTGGTLVVGLGKEPGNPNPFIQTQSTTQFVRETSYESLLTRDKNGRIVPNLAEAYTVSAGGNEFTLRLRKGVKFHNGKEMKADDVLWSANHVKDPNNGAFGQNIIKDVQSFDKIDEYTVKFTLSNPSAAFLSHLANIRMLPVVPTNSLKPGQIKLEKNVFVPGTGPFILEQFQPGFDTVVKRFHDYWGTAAYLDQVIFRPIADGTNRFNALRTGDVQMADRLSTLDAARVKKGEVKGVVIREESGGGFSQLVVNYDNPLFRKREMRQALLYATDKQRLVDEVFFGAAKPAELMMDPTGVWGRAANVPQHKRDVTRAKTLLKSAGYKGQELIFIVRKSSASLVESYQLMLAEAGIKVKPEILEAGVMKERYLSGKYDLSFAGGDITDDPVITMMPYYYTSKVEKGRYSNPKVDQLLDSLDKEFDEKKRLKIFRELAGILRADVATIPLFFESRYLGLLEKIQGFGPSQGGSYKESGNYFKHVWLQ